MLVMSAVSVKRERTRAMECRQRLAGRVDCVDGHEVMENGRPGSRSNKLTETRREGSQFVLAGGESDPEAIGEEILTSR
jgi:hypothetical protein